MLLNQQRVLDQAEHALCDGRLGEIIVMSRSVPSAEAAVLAARAMLLLQQDGEAKDLLSRAIRRYDRHLAGVTRGRLHCLLGASLTRLGRYDSAHVEFQIASHLCGALDDQELYAEILSHRAMSAWCQRRLLEASELAARAAEFGVIETRIRALGILALADACSGNFKQAMTLMVKALAECDREKHKTTLYQAVILWNLSGAIQAAGDINDFSFLEARLLALPRVDGLARFIGRGLDNLSLYYLRSQRLDDFIRIANDLLPIAIETQRVTALSRLAEAALLVGAHTQALEYITRAESVAASIDWSSEEWNYQSALLELARGLSKLAPQGAIRHLETYRTTRNAARPIYLESRHSVMVAEELESRGAVLAGLGKREEARNDLGEAMKLYEIGGFKNRLPAISELMTSIELERPIVCA